MTLRQQILTPDKSYIVSKRISSGKVAGSSKGSISDSIF